MWEPILDEFPYFTQVLLPPFDLNGERSSTQVELLSNLFVVGLFYLLRNKLGELKILQAHTMPNHNICFVQRGDRFNNSFDNYDELNFVKDAWEIDLPI